MEKIDLREQWKQFYKPSAKKAEIVDVPPALYVMIDGSVAPGQTIESSADFQEAIGALYGLTYTLKFAGKKRATDPIDFAIMPLQGLWWSDEGGALDLTNKDNWRWTLMIMLPDFVSEELFVETRAQLEKKKPSPAVARLRLERLHEGPSVQIMHMGPYSAEGPTIENMHTFAKDSGYSLRGKHHEIYLGDPRRGDQSKLRTILRHPVETK